MPEDTRDLSGYTVLDINFSDEDELFEKYGDCDFEWIKNSGIQPVYNPNNNDARLYRYNSLKISS